MNIKVITHTKIPGYAQTDFNIEQALLFCAKMAGICYMQEDFETILLEDKEKTLGRLKQTLNSGHHSVYDHFKITFEISRIPKIIAMILNNENDYTTSEKSSRYTNPLKELQGLEKELYFKWFEKLQPIILEKYPTLYKEKAKNPMLQIEKKAQENARYFFSIFTPITTMGYTVSLRQLNYLLYMMREYITTAEKNHFYGLMAPALEEFISLFKPYIIEGLTPEGKNRTLSIFGKKEYENVPDVYSYVYQHTLKASYACVAQLHRHRTEDYFVYELPTFEFYIPEILQEESLQKEWLEDAKKMDGNYPQGQLLKVINTGTIDTLSLQAEERMCGQAQLEIMRVVHEKVEAFQKHSPFATMLEEITQKQTAKCSYKNGKCTAPCIFGKKQFERHI